ncbi:unnamed protein product [Prorocentrum cordatum]|uniref:Uncharacterized protein n=1 Tax=Prorocentrum cordatum TaxID=2364126 RepID=A0ABN9RKR6_9DINO|nr:unnamed protein product [Polarella glacialis]
MCQAWKEWDRAAQEEDSAFSDSGACLLLPPGTNAAAADLSRVRRPGGGGIMTGSLIALATGAKEAASLGSLVPRGFGDASQYRRSAKLMTFAALACSAAVCSRAGDISKTRSHRDTVAAMVPWPRRAICDLGRRRITST